MYRKFRPVIGNNEEGYYEPVLLNDIEICDNYILRLYYDDLHEELGLDININCFMIDHNWGGEHINFQNAVIELYYSNCIFYKDCEPLVRKEKFYVYGLDDLKKQLTIIHKWILKEKEKLKR